ncbi:hypothetical protein F4810DRAFT_675750 [Camillea tinctor]|nr:hypothetical protein F4810DRAFT_675750 [Camillea tinctor]
MLFQTLLTTTLLAASTSAAAVALPRAPTEGSSTTFRLSANVTRFDLSPSVQGQQLSLLVTGDDCALDLALLPRGNDFYQTPRDTLAVVSDSGEMGVVVTPGGTATVPSLNTVQARCGDASPGVAVAPDANAAGAVDLQFENGGWMACPREEGSETVVLRFRANGQRILAGCADVQLLPLCEEGSAAGEAIETTCYTGL